MHVCTYVESIKLEGFLHWETSQFIASIDAHVLKSTVDSQLVPAGNGFDARPEPLYKTLHPAFREESCKCTFPYCPSYLQE